MADAELLSPLRDFAIALAIGALVGIEREKKWAEEAERGTAGLRTFILLAQAGALAAWLAVRLATPSIFIAGGLLVGAAMVVGYAVTARAQASYGLTTETAALVVYLLGGTVVFGFPELAVALAITTAALLAFKEPLHHLVDRIGRDDLYAGLQLLIATFIVLPLLPREPVDPWHALAPYWMWWLVILISGLSLVGYVATRWLGAGRGIPLTGLFGGLVSSTAVSLDFARKSRESPRNAAIADALAAGLLLSWSVMFVRVLVLVAAVQLPLLRSLLVPGVTLAGLAAAMALACYWRGAGAEASSADVPLRNPFSLLPAIRFAALFAAVLLVVKLVQIHLPGQGLYAVAALAGLTDVDAITLSMAGYVRGGGEATVATRSILIAMLTNTLVKLGFVVALGSAALWRRVGLATIILVAGGWAALLLRP